MNRDSLLFRLAVWGGLGMLCFAVYAQGLWVPYFGDDFLWYFTGTHAPFDHFTQPPEDVIFYRPLQSVYLDWAQPAGPGESTLWVHLALTASHAALCALVYAAGRHLGFARWQAGFAAALMAVAQVNAAAVLSNDTLSQVGGALLGWASLFLLWRHLGARPTRWRHLPCSVACFALALLLKETSVAFAPMAGLLVLALSVQALQQRPGRTLVRRGVLLVPFVLVLLGYFALRAPHAAPVRFGEEGRYALRLGLNVPRNAAQFAAAALTVVPTTDVFLWLKAGRWWPVAGAAALAASVATAAAWGLWHARRKPALFVLAVLAVLSVAPFTLAGHVSELYVYNAMPAVALLAGAGFGALHRRASGPRARATVLAGSVLLLAAHAAAVQRKTAQMKESAERIDRLLAEVVERAEAAPPGATLHLVPRGTRGPSYSVFVMDAVPGLHFAEHVVQHRAGRPDVSLAFGLSSPNASPAGKPTQILGVCGEGRLCGSPGGGG